MLIISMYLLSKLNEAAIRIGSFIAGSAVDTTSTVQATASESITMA